MNWLKKGPELKLPSLSGLRGGLGGGGPKAPDFLVDLYYDLRDRRLLPLVALAIVAIAAVPFLLGGEEPAPAPPVGGGGAGGGVAARSAKLAVVEATPGLRDYRKRLDGRAPTDPFEQRYTSPVLKGTELGNGDGPSSNSTSTSVTKTTETTKTNGDGETTTTTTTDETTETGGAKPQLTLYAFAIDAKVTRIAAKPGGGKEKQASVKHRVLPPNALPSEKNQVVTYMGIGPTSEKPLLLISNDVTAVYGDAECLSGSEACQLIEVEPGFPVTLVHGPSEVRYKINVLKVVPVVTGQAKTRPE